MSYRTFSQEIQEVKDGILLLSSMVEEAVMNSEDVQAAKAIIREDDIIDECYSRLYEEAIRGVPGDPGAIERANYVIWTAHNLERLGDRVANICKEVAYIVTSEQFELDAVLEKSRLDPGGSKEA